MRIGIDLRMYSTRFTGIGRVNYELVHNLLKFDRENQYILFFNNPEYESFDESIYPNVEKILVNAKHYSIKEQLHFLWLLNKSKLDLMHFTHFNNPILYFGKQIVTIHDMTLSYFPGKKLNSFIHRLAYNLCIWTVTWKSKKIIAVSNNTKNDLIKLLKIPEKKIQVIYEGVADSLKKLPESEIKKTLDKYKLDKPFLLYVGVWRDHKNVVGLIKAFNILRKEKKLDIYLVITGRADPVYLEVINTIKELGLENEVKLVGLVPDTELSSLYYSAKIFTFPSFYEGFGIPPLEAFSAGVPVACSNTSSLPEVCGDGNAIFFNPYDINEMAEKIYNLYIDEKLQKELIYRGKERIKFFSWTNMAKEILEIYNSLDTKNK